MIDRSRSAHLVLVAAAALATTVGCSKSDAKEAASSGAAASAAAAPAPPPSATPPAAPAAPAAPAELTCTKFATLDNAPTKRPPLQGSVKGARVPNGGTPEAQKPELYSISYWEKDRLGTACTVRKQLEDDKWSIDSMTGEGTSESPIIMLAKKATASIQVMVGPNKVASVTTVMITAK